MFDIDVTTPAISILVLCVVLATISKLLQRKFINKREMDYNKNRVKELQKEMQALMKKGDESSKKELDRVQNEMLEVNSKMLQSSMKLMWFTMPVFLIAYAAMGYFFGGQNLESFVALPKFSGFNILNPFSWVPVGWSTTTGFFKMYFVYYLICSLIANGIEAMYEKMKNKQ